MDYAVKKVELEERVRALEAEKTNLIHEIVVLNQRLELSQLSAKAKKIGGELDILKAQRSDLEEKITATEAEYTSPTTTTEEVAPQISA